MCVEWVFLGGCWPSSPMKRVYHVVSGCHHSFQLYVLKEPCWWPVLQQGGSFNTMWHRAWVLLLCRGLLFSAHPQISMANHSSSSLWPWGKPERAEFVCVLPQLILTCHEWLWKTQRAETQSVGPYFISGSVTNGWLKESPRAFVSKRKCLCA